MTDPTVRIIAVGDELLTGRTVDSNSRRIQRALGGAALQVAEVRVVPDAAPAIAAALADTREGDVVFVSGGLGSTPDDLTRDAVAGWAGVALAEDADVRAGLEERWRQRGLRRSPGVERQSQVPAGMTALANPVGSAPGLVGRLRGRTVVLLPGVPAELEGLLPAVLAHLRGLGVLPAPRPTRLWRTVQVAELAVVDRCAPVRRRYPDLAWSWWLTEWGVDVRLTAAGDVDGEEFAAAGDEVDRILDPIVFARSPLSLPAALRDLMLARGATLAVAESCTGGLVAARLTDEPGASGYFRGGVIAYADAVKEAELAVPAALLAEHGAVSEPVVAAMAAGVRTRFGVDHAVAVSGVAGPDGGTAAKPVGTTWIAVATPAAVFARRHRFTGDRARNRLLATAVAIDAVRRVLVGGDGIPPWRDDDTWSRP